MGNFKNTKKIKFIMKWVIFATILVVLFSVLLCVIFLDKEEKLPPINDEYVDNGDEEDTSIVQEMHVVSNLKDEYYLNEDFDITDIEIFVKYKTQGGFVSKYLKLTSDFIDGYPEETELLICEGQSAGGSASQARDVNTQAVLPLRGKILNTFNIDKDRILDNAEIQSICGALGTGIGPNFDYSKLRK